MGNLYRHIRPSKSITKIIDKLPSKKELNSAFSAFSKKERTVFSVLLVVLLVSTVLILQNINRRFMVSVPMHGGSINEGIIGTPRFVNPVLASSPADKDLVALVYSGLMRKTSTGDLIPDLAETYEISKDGLTYTFTLKNGIYFQDGEPVTMDDIIFTVNTVKDSVIKSPHKIKWDGVTVLKIDEKTVSFTLKQPYADFLENTTLGIMPSYIWDGTPLELNNANTEPIGSGPYMISDINKQAEGTIDSYELSAFKKFALGKPYIKNINLYFYTNEDDLINALSNKEVVQISSVSPLSAETLREAGYKIKSETLPRVFGLFFNQNVNQLFTDKTVVSAIDEAIDRERIIRTVLAGYGVAIHNPIPLNMTQYQKSDTSTKLPRGEILQKIQDRLSQDGWEKNSEGFLQKTEPAKKPIKGAAPAKSGAQGSASSGKKIPLRFSISTSNSPELVKTATLIKEDLALIGIQVDIKTFELNDLNQQVIRPRKYDALLFGQIINNESDLFAFWHSSQRLDPGLNVAMYTNAKVDKILEDAFVTVNRDSRIKKYIQFEEEIKKDKPAIFIYSPSFIYVLSPNLEGLSLGGITSSSDRFSDIHLWYTQKDNVWKIFTK